MGDGAITIEQGLNFDEVFEPFEDVAMTARATLDGYRIIMQARPYRGADELLLDLASDDGTGRLRIEDATGDPPGKVIRVHLDASQTLAVAQGGVYEFGRVDVGDPDNVDSLGGDDLVLVEKIIEASP